MDTKGAFPLSFGVVRCPYPSLKDEITELLEPNAWVVEEAEALACGVRPFTSLGSTYSPFLPLESNGQVLYRSSAIEENDENE